MKVIFVYIKFKKKIFVYIKLFLSKKNSGEKIFSRRYFFNQYFDNLSTTFLKEFSIRFSPTFADL